MIDEPEEDSSDILDDIKALEDVLAQERNIGDKDVSICNLPRRTNFPVRGFGELTPLNEDCEEYESENVVPRSALEANEKLVQLLKDTKTEVTLLLDKCLENLSVITEKIRLCMQNSSNKTKVMARIAGMPYFKDVKQYCAPKNSDAIEKSNNGEISIVRLERLRPWTAKDYNILWKAICREAANIILSEQKYNDDASAMVEMTKLHQVDSEETAEITGFNLPNNFREMIGSVGVRDYDWLKIAVTDLRNEHTADECMVLWNVFLHPDINKSTWTLIETSKLIKLSKRFQYQDWDGIAKALATGRSGYQCFIKFTTNNLIIGKSIVPWSQREDARLLRCIDKLRIGQYIPWGSVAKYLGKRSKKQIYYRWVYNIAPHLKKGRFTMKEDLMLLEALKTYGKNFSKISMHVLPHRSSVQLSNHYETLVQRLRDGQNNWSLNQDTKLLKLYNKYGPNWSNIARQIPEKSRTQVRHRHAAILSSWKKGISLYDMPRQGRPTVITTTNTSEDNKAKSFIECLEREKLKISTPVCRSQQIDTDLLNYFRKMPPLVQPGRKKKYYEPEELTDATTKLLNLLQILEANLELPSKFYHRTLTEKDKQLLISLKNHERMQEELAEAQTRSIAYGGIEFGETLKKISTREDNQTHFAPLCSGNCNINDKKKWHDSIEYQHRQELENSRIKLNMRFDTPKNIIDLIGIHKNHEFNKLLDIFVTRNNFSSTIKFCGTEGRVSRNLSFDLKTGIDKSMIIQSTDRKRKRTDENDQQLEGYDLCQRVNRDENLSNYKLRSIEPSYHSLLGFQHIISNDCNVLNPETKISVGKNNKKAEAAMRLLRIRLFKLFKYPIGLSHIMRPKTEEPEVVEELQCDEDRDETFDKRKIK